MLDTPYYSVDLKVACDSFRQICADLRGCTVHYCLKANGESPLLKALAAQNAPFEVSSDGEFDMAIAAGVRPTAVICGVPVLTIPAIQRLYSGGCRYFVFDSPATFHNLEGHAPTAAKVLRLNLSHISPEAIEFGATTEEVHAWVDSKEIEPSKVTGLAFDLRRNVQATPVLEALRLCEHLLPLFPKANVLNIGGNYRLSWEVGSAYYAEVLQELDRIRRERQLAIYAEIGRSVVKHAGSLFCRVILTKRRPDHVDVYLDAGVPSGVTHSPTFVRLANDDPKQPVTDQIECRFFGTTCCHTCLFTLALPFQPSAGDVLELAGMGAYTICKRSAFHGWPLTPVYYHEPGKMLTDHTATSDAQFDEGERTCTGS